MLWVNFHGNSEESLGREPRKRRQRSMDFKWFIGIWKRRLCDSFLKRGATSSSQEQSLQPPGIPRSQVSNLTCCSGPVPDLASPRALLLKARVAKGSQQHPEPQPQPGCPQPVPAHPRACRLPLLSPGTDLCYPIRIPPCTSGIAVGLITPHKGASRKCDFIGWKSPPLSQESDCRLWIWLRAKCTILWTICGISLPPASLWCLSSLLLAN